MYRQQDRTDMKNTRKNAAFTLHELLVTVGVIGVLAGILMPVVGRAKLKAKRAQSQNNLRQLIQGYLGYEADYQALMPFNEEANSAWVRHLQEREKFSMGTLLSPMCRRHPSQGAGDALTAWNDSHGPSRYECVGRI